MDKIKKFFSDIKKDVKSPVKTPEEAAARKKKYGTFALYCIGAVVVFGALSGILSKVPVLGSVFQILVFVPAIAGIFCGFLWFVANKISKKFKDIFCDKCNTRISYGENVTFSVLGKREVRSSSSDSKHAEAQIKEYTKVRITCTCQNCGAEKTFDHEFCTNIIKADSRRSAADVKVRPIEELIQNYFGDVIEIGY